MHFSLHCIGGVNPNSPFVTVWIEIFHCIGGVDQNSPLVAVWIKIGDKAGAGLRSLADVSYIALLCIALQIHCNFLCSIVLHSIELCCTVLHNMVSLIALRE